MKLPNSVTTTTIIVATLLLQSAVSAATKAPTPASASTVTSSSAAVTSQSSSSVSSDAQKSSGSLDLDQKFMMVTHHLDLVPEDTPEDTIPPLENGEASSVKFNSCRMTEELSVDPSAAKTASASAPSLTMDKRKGKGCPIFAIATNNAMGKIYYSSVHRKLQAWDLEHKKSETLAPNTAHHTDTITAITMLSNRLVASGDMSGTTCIWDVVSNKVCSKLSRETNQTGLPVWERVENPVWSLAPVDEKTLAAGYSGLPIALIDIESGALKDEIFGTNNALALAKLPNGNLVAGFWNGTIKIIDPQRNIILQTLEGHTGCIGALIALADGRVISGSYDGTVRIWNTQNSKEPCLATLKGHRDAVLSLALLPEDLLASGCKDGTVYIWDLCQNDYPRIKILRERTGPITALAAYKTTRLISGSLDGIIRAWQLGTTEN